MMTKPFNDAKHQLRLLVVSTMTTFDKSRRHNLVQGFHVFKIEKILKWPKVPEDSSDFDDSWTVRIVVT